MAVSKNQELAWQTRWFAWWHWWASALPTAINPLGTAPKRQEETVNYSNSRAHVMMNISSRLSSLMMAEELTRFLKANNLFLSMPGRQDSRICSAVKRTVLVWASKIVLLKIMPRRSGSETKKVPFIDRGISKTRPPVSRHLKYKSSNTKVMKGNQNWNT